jgi:MFS family permease
MSRYAALLARTGARSLALACGLGWLSFASYGFAIVLAVADATGSFASAGAAVGAFSAGAAVFAPVRGRYVDRRGARALALFAPVHAVALGLLVVGCLSTDSSWLLAGAAGVAGLSSPPLIATARAVWPEVAGPELVTTAHALNAALGDAGLVVGPALTGAVAALASPVTALAILVPGATTGALLLARHAPPATPSVRPPSSHRILGVLRESRGLRTIVLCDLASGLWLGALDVSAPLVASTGGSAASGAVPLALFAAGSILASLVAGSLKLQRSAPSRYVAGTVIVALTLPLCLVFPSLFGISAVLVAVGAGFGLLNVALFELLDEIIAPDRAVEAFTWLTTWQGLGLAVGATLAGQLSSHGPSASLVVVAAPGLLAAAVVIARRSTLRGAAETATV